MAIQFDPNNRVIMLDSFNVSASTIWSRWLDWSVLSDNLKYLPAFSQVGGVAPIPLYLTLGNGWKVRVQEADGTTKITGNLLTSDGLTPFAPTLGAFNTQVILESPIAAQAIEVNTGSGLTAEQAQMLADISIKLGTPSFDISTDIAAVKSDTEATRSKTDQLAFTQANSVDANVQHVNDTQVNGNGTPGNEWGP